MRIVDDRERRARLAVRHALAPGHRVASVEAAVEAVVCLHATDAASVYLSAFARSGATREEVSAALYDRRSVVRQLAMRRTLFVFPTDLLPAVLGSASARVAAQQEARLIKELEAAGIARDGAAWLGDLGSEVRARVETGPAATAQLREEVPGLAERLDPAPGKPYGGPGPIASRVLSVLAADGSLQRGHNDGGWRVSRPRWTAHREWLGRDREALGAPAGYAELVRRWLRAFGPGTEADIVWWLGATKGAVRQALAEVEAAEVALENGEIAYLHPEDDEAVEPPEPWAALLPPLDPTTMGWKRRDFYLGPHTSRMFDSAGNGGPTAWWEGRIVGTWIQETDGSVVVVEAERLPDDARRALDAEAERLGAWLGGEVLRSSWQAPLAREEEKRRGLR